MSDPASFSANFDRYNRSCWVLIDEAQLASNFRQLSHIAGTSVLAVVKANGYGHGYLHAAQAFLNAGARYLGVATLSEAFMLRDAGILSPILIICGLLPEEMMDATERQIDFFVWRQDHIDRLRQRGMSGAHAKVHLKINTGMGRLGCKPEEAVGIAQEISVLPNVELVGLATHFASAYNPSLPDTDRQIDLFNQVIGALNAVGIRPPITHAANSSGALCYPHGRYDMVRIGISLYGVPGDMIPLPEGVTTALTWHARVTSTSVLPKGHGVSYSGEYVMPEEGRVGVLPVGYADGFQRVPKNVNTVLIEGQERRILGRICMDQCIVDLKGLGDVTGAEVILIGKQGSKELYIKDIAKRWGTNAHDVYCGIAPRVPRRSKK